jgi:hypothetical protein
VRDERRFSPFCPSEFLGRLLNLRTRRSGDHPLMELAARLKSASGTYRLIGWRNHFVIGSFSLNCVVFLFPDANLSSAAAQAPPSPSLAFLQSLTQLTLAASPQRCGSSHELLFPSAQVRIGDPLFGRLPPLPSFRLPGLFTRLTVYSLRFLVSFVSHSPRSWDSPLRSLTSCEVLRCLHRNGPTCRSSHALRKQQPLARRREPQLLGFTPR